MYAAREAAVAGRIRVWGLALWAVSAVTVLVLTTVNALPDHEGDWPWVVGLMAFPVAAALVLARRPGNAVGRALGAVGLATTILFPLSWYAEMFPDSLATRAAEAVVASAVVCQFGALLLLIHVFPTGRPAGRWHALVVRALWAWWVIVAAGALVRPGPMDLTARANPFGLGGDFTLTVLDSAFWFLPAFAVLGVVALFVRRRHADPVEQAQLKWFFAAAAAVFTMLVMILLTPEKGWPGVQLISELFVVVAFWSLPAATVVAVTRYGLFEIDRIVSRTATYGVVAAVLAAVYGLVVIVLQWALPLGSSSIAVAASTLAAAALFSPVRRRVQHALDRRFNRARYESDLVAQRFALQVRHNPALDTDAIRDDLADVIRTTLQPEAVQLWLAGPRRT